ncbi:MAG: diacylglycerol kinase family lipid kinase [Anaerolineae bacterium]|jgi:YegS/Rv2252/BmrU family lipid kinase
MGKSIQVIVNPAAGQPEAILAELNQVFGQAGVDWQVAITQQAGDGTRLAREAVDRGVDLVAAYGGDGTVMEVVSGLIDRDVPLAILPGGTGNVLATELQIPPGLADAARLAAGDETPSRRVDVGRCGDCYFLLRLATGFNARQIQATTREMRDRYGRLAYFIAALQALPDTQPVQFRFTLDGEPVEYEAVTCIVANAGNLGIPGLSLSPLIRIDDGLLDLVAVHNLDLEALSSLAASIADLAPEPENLGHWQAQQITIEADPAQPVVADGEDAGQTPITLDVLPEAVRILVPADPAQ